MKCYVATGNAGKAKEIKAMGEHFFPEIEEWIFRAPKDAEETGSTFLENAKIKADALAAELIEEGISSCFVLADDSGLEVEALGGAPGIHSARYAGDHVAPEKHISLLLNNMKQFTSLNDRECNYTCALYLTVLLGKNRREFSSIGTCEGFIGFESKGEFGFGYDPIFLMLDKTTGIAELAEKEKNEISHRWDAFEQLVDELREQTH
ncbi:non-canonical purine NTP pyrophosphatase [bacterium]|nr:non-canonical purine NTP pyrophosphatase [bacterium]